MKKLFLSLVAAIVAATATYAQSSMLATLSHEGEISTYYGATALREAHEAAADGDIITLSSGTFVATNITKAITIHGAGMEVNASLKIEPTVITGDFTININEETTERLTIEGIYSNHTISFAGTLKNATFMKDRFKTIDYYNANSILMNATFIHCKIANGLKLYENSTVSCVNCVVWGPSGNYPSTCNFEFQNCVVYSEIFTNYVKASSFKSSVLLSQSYSIESSCIAYNCIGIGTSSIFQSMPNNSNAVKTFEEVFKTLKGYRYNDSENFELTDDAQTNLLGMDGTQVGIYGGNMPFDSTPTNPQITKCNVAAKSTADGKLSVDIEVNGAE